MHTAEYKNCHESNKNRITLISPTQECGKGKTMELMVPFLCSETASSLIMFYYLTADI